MESQDPISHVSDLEVDWPRQQSEKLQPLDNEGLQHVRVPDYSAKTNTDYDGRSPRILGLSIGMFWLVVAVIALVLAGSIGGGVAGGLAAQKRSCTPGPDSVSSICTSLTPASNSPASTSTASTSSAPTSSASTSSASTSSAPSSSASPPSGSTASSTVAAANGGPSPAISSPCTGNSAANGTVLIANDPSGSNDIIGATRHAFQLICNTNYPAGATYGNPNVIDLLHIFTPDLAGCIDACAEYNLGYAVTSGGPRCVAASVVKTPGSYCFLKNAIGLNNTSTSNGAAIDTAILVLD